MSLLRNLHYLRLSLVSCDQVHAMFKLLGQNKLLDLNLVICPQFTGEENMSDLKANLEHLETICIDSCTDLTNKGFC